MDRYTSQDTLFPAHQHMMLRRTRFQREIAARLQLCPGSATRDEHPPKCMSFICIHRCADYLRVVNRFPSVHTVFSLAMWHAIEMFTKDTFYIMGWGLLFLNISQWLFFHLISPSMHHFRTCSSSEILCRPYFLELSLKTPSAMAARIDANQSSSTEENRHTC